MTGEDEEGGAVDLYWLPVGAGGWAVRIGSGMYEALSAAVERRRRRPLFHAALEVRVDGARVVAEMTPIPDRLGSERGVVAEGPVGMRLAGRLRVFRYEVRRWPGGSIPDVAWAVESPVRVGGGADLARRVLDLIPRAPAPVWGRDDLRTGEMWNSNSLIAWVLARAGLPAGAMLPPRGGRAPGWHAGLVVAGRMA